jgi:hypothetical protein
MDLRYGPGSDAYRDRIRGLIAAALPPGWRGFGALPAIDREPFLTRWRGFLRDNGLLAPGWPAEYGGGGLGVVEQSIVAEELTRAGAPAYGAPTDPAGFVLLGPTLMACGTTAQQEYFLPRTIDGQVRWAQGYSEPEAGSDLFSLRTRAALKGDTWVVNGQKIWQTAGISANWIFILARTEQDVPGAKGLSFIMLPLEQPGVEVRGIQNMAGEVEFAEVFFADAVASAAHVVGGRGEGARVAMTLLGFERGTGGVAEAMAAQIELRRLVELARQHGLEADPVTRDRIAVCRTTIHVLHCLALRALSSGAADRPPATAESSVMKLVSSEYRKRVTELAVDILGSDALAATGEPGPNTLGAQPLGTDPLSSAAWLADYLHARPGTVYGGSSEIQRNTIGERVLGLPREPRAAAGARR